MRWLLVCLVLLAGCGGAPSAAQQVYDVCRARADETLLAPATAQYRPFEETPVGEPLEDGARVTILTVDSENAYGALVRTRFRCEVEPDGDGWRVRHFLTI